MAQQPDRKPPPKYRKIADDLRARIEAGEYPAGTQLPTKAELMERHSAALATVDHALDELRSMGLAETRQGIGTFARTPPPPEEVSSRYAALEERLQRTEADVTALQQQMGRIEAQLAEPGRREATG